MIEANFAVRVIAHDDNEVDAVLATLTAQSKTWPGYPTIQVREIDRKELPDG